MLFRKPPVPEDLSGIDAVLRDERPQLPADRMRFVAARARSRARVSTMQHTPQKESFLRSRIAITLMLVFGFAFSTAGVGMAVQGVAPTGLSAQQSQYDQAPQQPLVPAPDRNEVPDEVDEGPTPPTNDRGGNEVAGEQESGDRVAGDQAQESRQLGAEASAADELPFTGFAAIPVLLMGFVLLTAGFVLRRRA